MPSCHHVFVTRRALATVLLRYLLGQKADNGGEITVQYADALEPSSYSELLQSAKGVIVAVG